MALLHHESGVDPDAVVDDAVQFIRHVHSLTRSMALRRSGRELVFVVVLVVGGLLKENGP